MPPHAASSASPGFRGAVNKAAGHALSGCSGWGEKRRPVANQESRPAVFFIGRGNRNESPAYREEAMRNSMLSLALVSVSLLSGCNFQLLRGNGQVATEHRPAPGELHKISFASGIGGDIKLGSPSITV